MLSGACWLKQFSVIAVNLPGSGSPRIAKGMHANQSVASAEDDCSGLPGFFAKDIQRASPNDTESSSILTGCSVGSWREGTLEKDVVVFGKRCGGGGGKEEEQRKTDRKKGPEKSSKHEMSEYQ